MKLSALAKAVIFGLSVGVLPVGCESTPRLTSNSGESATTLGGRKYDPDTTTLPFGTESSPPKSIGVPFYQCGTWPEDREALQGQTVHFDSSSTVAKTEEKSRLAFVADYLKANPTYAVRIEGHTDERGAQKNNRALGERRALAVRRQLIRLGIDPHRIDTFSYGADKPDDCSHTERAWKKNRRCVFVLLTPPKPPQ